MFKLKHVTMYASATFKAGHIMGRAGMFKYFYIFKIFSVTRKYFLNDMS